MKQIVQNTIDISFWHHLHLVFFHQQVRVLQSNFHCLSLLQESFFSLVMYFSPVKEGCLVSLRMYMYLCRRLTFACYFYYCKIVLIMAISQYIFCSFFKVPMIMLPWLFWLPEWESAYSSFHVQCVWLLKTGLLSMATLMWLEYWQLMVLISVKLLRMETRLCIMLPSRDLDLYANSFHREVSILYFCI